MLTARDLITKFILGLVLLGAVMLVASAFGSQQLSIHKILEGPGITPGQNTDYEIFVGVRLPRILLAAIVGAALGGAGVVLQAILRNPLADPFILGISSGAGLGAIIAVISGLTFTAFGASAISVFAFCGAILTVWLVWLIGHYTARSQPTSLLLAGVVVNAFFSAVIMFLISIAKSDQLQSTIFWLMGNIRDTSLSVAASSGAITVAGLLILLTICMELNILTFGPEQAKSLGVNPAKINIIGFGAASIITAVAVSLSGLVGFVGLIVPHAVRLVFGPDHRQLLILSSIAGAIFLVIADTIARTVVAPAQLPVGVITAIAGGPFFLLLLAKYTRKVDWVSK